MPGVSPQLSERNEDERVILLLRTALEAGVGRSPPLSVTGCGVSVVISTAEKGRGTDKTVAPFWPALLGNGVIKMATPFEEASNSLQRVQEFDVKKTSGND